VHLLKYAGWWRIADPMARLMARLTPPLQPGILVPVPLSAKRARARGYNQAEKLAVAFGRHARLAVNASLLTRGRDTPSQTALAPEARRANIADAFVCRAMVPGAHVILVDDVFTTGATLVEVAITMLEAGALTVDAVTFARAQPPLGQA
jgi:ComF family protein